MSEISWDTLATIAGASIAAGVFTEFVKKFWASMSDQAYRMVSAASGLLVVEGAYLLSGVINIQGIILAGFVGMQAGLAASQAYETGKHGLDRTVTRP